MALRVGSKPYKIVNNVNNHETAHIIMKHFGTVLSYEALI